MDRVQYFECKAKMRRWEEELCILLAEQKRVKRFMEFYAQSWGEVAKEKECEGTGDSRAEKEHHLGSIAYAYSQQAMYRALIARMVGV